MYWVLAPDLVPIPPYRAPSLPPYSSPALLNILQHGTHLQTCKTWTSLYRPHPIPLCILYIYPQAGGWHSTEMPSCCVTFGNFGRHVYRRTYCLEKIYTMSCHGHIFAVLNNVSLQTTLHYRHITLLQVCFGLCGFTLDIVISSHANPNNMYKRSEYMD